MTPRLSVVIPSYRGLDLVLTCLASVERAVQATEAPIEVIVVDDGSGDDTAAVTRREHPGVEVIERPVNGGYPACVNSGLRAARAPWILTLNNDTTVDEHVFTELLSALDAAAPDVGSAAAQQRFSDRPDVIYSAGIVLDRIGINADRRIGQPAHVGETTPVDVFGACGGAAIYARRMLDDVGLLDEGFEFGLEDADIAWRARMNGWSCLYVPSALVYHDVGGTVAYGSEKRFLQAGRNRVRLVVKNADRRMLLRYGPAMIAYDVAYMIVAGLRHRTLSPVRGRLESLRRWRVIRASGRPGRKPVELAPVMGVRAALERRTNLIRR